MSTEYNASSIKELKFPENIRRRPGMYIGTTDDAGRLVLLREPLDNGIDEALAGYGTEIKVDIDSRLEQVTISDTGRGMPVGLHESGEETLEMLVSKTHAGGKFDKDSYKTSGGLNGIGVKATNALSTKFVVTSIREGKRHTLEYAKGIKVGDMKVVPLKKNKAETGTEITFVPDSVIFRDTEHPFYLEEDVFKLIHQKAYLNPTVKFVLNFDKTAHAIQEGEGLNKYVRDLIDIRGDEHLISKVVDIDGIYNTEIINDSGEKELAPIKVRVAFTYGTKYDEEMLGFCNTIYQADGGTHITGCKMSIGKCMLDYISSKELLKGKNSKLDVQSADALEGISLVVSVFHPCPTYRGQEKQKLGNTEVQGVIQKMINTEFAVWLESNPNEAKAIAMKVIACAMSRIAAKRAKDQTRSADKGLFALNGIAKLSNCTSKDPEECELILIEGDSAGGTADDGRNKQIQATYALKGKPLNCIGKSIELIAKNKELSDLVGVLKTGSGKNFDISKLRYHKVIINADADDDGLHIISLLIGFFWSNMRQLITDGHLYVANPPLYRVSEGAKTASYLANDVDLAKFMSKRLTKYTKEYGLVYEGEEDGYEISETMISAFLSKAKEYRNAVELFSNKFSLPSTLIEDILSQSESMDSFVDQDEEDILGEVVDYIEGKGGDFFKFNEDTNELSSILNDEFIHMFINDDFCDELNRVIRAYVKFEQSMKKKPYFFINAESGEELTFIEFYHHLEKNSNRNVNITRFKGLGEMSAADLWDTTLNPETRRLYKLTVIDEEAVDLMVDDLLNKNKPDVRKELMSKFSKNLSVNELITS
jgi:DNA gyrase subunit B